MKGEKGVQFLGGFHLNQVNSSKLSIILKYEREKNTITIIIKILLTKSRNLRIVKVLLFDSFYTIRGMLDMIRHPFQKLTKLLKIHVPLFLGARRRVDKTSG